MFQTLSSVMTYQYPWPVYELQLGLDGALLRQERHTFITPSAQWLEEIVPASDWPSVFSFRPVRFSTDCATDLSPQTVGPKQSTSGRGAELILESPAVFSAFQWVAFHVDELSASGTPVIHTSLSGDKAERERHRFRLVVPAVQLDGSLAGSKTDDLTILAAIANYCGEFAVMRDMKTPCKRVSSERISVRLRWQSDPPDNL
jgi:hypothetical protein